MSKTTQQLDPPTAIESPPAAMIAVPESPPSEPLKPRLCRRIALLNQKGGVGKTTTTANLGAALAKAGHQVLLVDLDPQAHLSLHLGLEPAELDKTLYQLISDEQTNADEVVVAINENLAILPAEVNMAGLESELAADMMTGRAQRALEQKCRVLLEQGPPPAKNARRKGRGQRKRPPLKPRPFDFVLIDCPPSLGLLTINALTLANEVIVPMQAHFLALQGLSKLFDTVRLVRQSFNPKLEVTGIVLCMHEGQTLLAGEIHNDLTSFLDSGRGTDLPWRNAVVYEPAIRRNIKLAESPSFGQTIFDYAPECHGASDYESLAKAVVGQVVETENV